MQITLTHPRNELCRLIIKVLDWFGVDASENKHLTKTEVYENAGIAEIFISPDFGRYFAEFYGNQTKHKAKQ